jgi:hypothetical protein
MVGRWFSPSYLAETFADKMSVDVRPFGKAAQNAAVPAAKHYLAYMIAQGGFENKEQKFGGTMHQLDAAGFKAALDALKAADPVLAAAAAGGADFWATTFAELTN